MSIYLRRILLSTLCLRVFAYAGWSVYQSVASKTLSAADGCDGGALGSMRIAPNGTPQICVKR